MEVRSNLSSYRLLDPEVPPPLVSELAGDGVPVTLAYRVLRITLAAQRRSIGRVGAAGDNAAMESFWSLLQTNVLNQRRWATRPELRLVIVVWIERAYHRQRPQDSLAGLRPIEYGNKITLKTAPAA